MVNYWLCVTNEKNWEVIRRKKIWGVSRRNQKQLEKTEINDFLVFYVKPKKLVGIFKIVSKPFESEEEIFRSTRFAEKEIFPYRIELEPVVVPKEPRDFKELIPKLGFIARKDAWRAYLRKAMQWISKDSYEIMRQALKTA